MSCQESMRVRGPANRDCGTFFSRNTANLVHSSKSFYCLSPGLTREGPRNAEVAHQAQLIPKLVFLFNEPGLTPSKMSTIIAILGCQLRGHFSLQDLLRYCASSPGERAEHQGCFMRERRPQLSPFHTQQHCPSMQQQVLFPWTLLETFSLFMA